MKPSVDSEDLYAQLEALPEQVTGKIINGRLYTQPRPAGPHIGVGSGLGGELYGPYHRGRGGPGGWWILVEPDWVCKILSPSTARTDRVTKMPVYARHGVPYLWLVGLLAHTLEAFALHEGRWTVIGLFQEQDPVAVEPFTAVALELGGLWAEVDES